MGNIWKDWRVLTIPASAQPPGKIKEGSQAPRTAAGGAQVVCPTIRPDNGKLLPRVLSAAPPGSRNLHWYSNLRPARTHGMLSCFPNQGAPNDQSFLWIRSPNLFWSTLDESGFLKICKNYQICCWPSGFKGSLKYTLGTIQPTEQSKTEVDLFPLICNVFCTNIAK